MGGMNSMTGGMGMGMDRMSSSFDRMGPAMGAGLERNIDMDRGFVAGPMGSGMRERLGSKGNQIFVRNVSMRVETNKTACFTHTVYITNTCFHSSCLLT